jgi:hypothetical protein
VSLPPLDYPWLFHLTPSVSKPAEQHCRLPSAF